MGCLKPFESLGKAYRRIAIEFKTNVRHIVTRKDRLNVLERQARPQASVLENNGEPFAFQKAYHRNTSSPASWVIKAFSTVATAAIRLRIGFRGSSISSVNLMISSPLLYLRKWQPFSADLDLRVGFSGQYDNSFSRGRIHPNIGLSPHSKVRVAVDQLDPFVEGDIS